LIMRLGCLLLYAADRNENHRKDNLK